MVSFALAVRLIGICHPKVASGSVISCDWWAARDADGSDRVHALNHALIHTLYRQGRETGMM